MENKKVKTILAKVLSNKMDKSATVIVERQIKHPVNGKFIKRTSKYHIHDENNIISTRGIIERDYEKIKER